MADGRSMLRRELQQGHHSLIVCPGIVLEENYGDGVIKERLTCELDHQAYLVDVDEDWLKTVLDNYELVSGETTLSLTNYEIHGSTMRSTTEGSNPPSLTRMSPAEIEKRRKLSGVSVTGTKTILAVNIIHNDINGNTIVNPYNNSVLSADLFTYADPGSDYWENTLHSQTLHCSNNQLNFQPAANEATQNSSLASDIFAGVVTVAVSTDCTETAATWTCYVPMEIEVTTALQAAFGVDSATDLADHLVYCMPLGKKLENVDAHLMPLAVAEVNNVKSFYRDEQCLNLVTLMHELGHNYNLEHSGQLINGVAYEYKDKSGVMGSTNGDKGGNRRCYNGAKNWQLGWYSDYHHEYHKEDGVWQGSLVGVTEINGTGHTMIVKINEHDEALEDYYVSFNRNNTFNQDSFDGANQVLVHRKEAEHGNPYKKSWRETELSAGESYTTPSGVTVTVQSIDTAVVPALANVTISAPTPQPTPGPTPQPTPLPTPQPTPLPTPQPSPAPVMQWDLLDQEDFENGQWETSIFETPPVIKDARINSIDNARSGTYVLIIRDGSQTSIAVTDRIDLDGGAYKTVKLSFWVRPKSLDSGDYFDVRYKMGKNHDSELLRSIVYGDTGTPINERGDIFSGDKVWHQVELFVQVETWRQKIFFEFQTYFAVNEQKIQIDDVEVFGSLNEL